MIDYGFVEIPYEFLLSLLQLDGGEIQAVESDITRRSIRIRVKHDEMPKVKAVPGICLLPSQLSYSSTTCGHTCELGKHKVTTREPITKYGFTYGDTSRETWTT